MTPDQQLIIYHLYQNYQNSNNDDQADGYLMSIELIEQGFLEGAFRDDGEGIEFLLTKVGNEEARKLNVDPDQLLSNFISEMNLFEEEDLEDDDLEDC